MNAFLALPASTAALHGAALWLPVVSAAVIAIAVLLYVVLDGFDLGIGILFAFERTPEDRDVMVNSVAPVWDGNETWLVFGGAGLFGLFPVAYATVLPALYPTLIAMLLCLIFRGVAFEFRFRAHSARGRRMWDFAFFLGSTLGAFAQGLTLGGLIQGIRVVDGQYAGGWWDWLTPFSVLCGASLVVGYGLLGATYLVWRTDGELQRRVRRHASYFAIATLAAIVAVSIWTPLLHRNYLMRWDSWPNIVLVAPVPVLVAVLGLVFVYGIEKRHHLTPFLCALGWFVLGFTGLGISIWPFIVPPSVDLWQASDPPQSQLFLLVGAAVLMPTIMAYSAYSYYVFRGKVDAGAHYH